MRVCTVSKTDDVTGDTQIPHYLCVMYPYFSFVAAPFGAAARPELRFEGCTFRPVDPSKTGLWIPREQPLDDFTDSPGDTGPETLRFAVPDDLAPSLSLPSTLTMDVSAAQPVREATPSGAFGLVEAAHSGSLVESPFGDLIDTHGPLTDSDMSALAARHLPMSLRETVVCPSEVDALLVHDRCSVPAVSIVTEPVVACGIDRTDARLVIDLSTPPSVVAAHRTVRTIARFAQATLWFGSGIAELATRDSVALHLGYERCVFIATERGALLPSIAASGAAPDGTRAGSTAADTAETDGDVADADSGATPAAPALEPHDVGSPLETLRAGVPLAAVYDDKELHVPAVRSYVSSFASLMPDVRQRFVHAVGTNGVRPSSECNQYFMKGLFDTLGGVRRGEMTVFSGATGLGKTTMLAQLALLLALPEAEGGCDVRSLFCSFEVPYATLGEKLFRQYIQLRDPVERPPEHGVKGVEEEVSAKERHAVWKANVDAFSRLPLQTLKHHGQYSTDSFIGLLESHLRSITPPDVLILDNLNFMLGGGSTMVWDRQDEAIRRLRVFATQNNVHVIVVMHPKKPSSGELSVEDIAGTARATQEADNVIILDHFKPSDAEPWLAVGAGSSAPAAFLRTSNLVMLRVRKNRHAGVVRDICLQKCASTAPLFLDLPITGPLAPPEQRVWTGVSYPNVLDGHTVIPSPVGAGAGGEAGGRAGYIGGSDVRHADGERAKEPKAVRSRRLGTKAPGGVDVAH